MKEEPKKVAVYLTNGIGNFLMWSPFLRTLARWWECKIDVISVLETWRRAAAQDICKRSPIIDRFIPLFEEEFNPDEYDRIFWAAHNEHPPKVKEYLKGLEDRYGTERGSKLVQFPRYKWRALKIHEVEYYMSALYDLGYRGTIPPMEIPKAKGPKIEGNAFKVGFCNGAFTGNEIWLKKLWPIERWVELSKMLRIYYDAEIYLVGGDNLAEGHARIPSTRDFTGELSICETAKVIHQMDLFVTTDTGPMHVAAALNRPLIALFGSTQLTKNRPWMRSPNRARVIQHQELSCVPCQDTELMNTCTDYRCMNAITPGEVMHEVRGLEKDGIIRPLHARRRQRAA